MNIAYPPGPRDRLLGLTLLRDMAGDYLGFWSRMQQAFGDSVSLHVMGRATYCFMHPDQIREVLVEKNDAFIRYERHMDVLREVHGQSLLISEGDIWKQQRRTLLPGFSPKRFDGYARQMAEAASGALDGLARHGGKPFDFEHAMNMLAMDVILRTMFSSSVAADTKAIEQAVRYLSQTAYEDMFYPFSLPDWLPLPGKRTKRQARKLLDDLIWSHIRVRRSSGERRDDILGMLLSAADEEGDGSHLSDRDIRNQLMTTFLAGHETTASGLTWAGWVLAAHKDVARRAMDEVDTVLQGRTPTFADVARLPYLGQVVKETLRLYSPAPGVFMRQAATDVEIGGYRLAKGALVVILSAIPHRDGRWFPDPDRFDPDRFTPDASKQIPRGAYFPFGTGPRVCIGNSFAAMEMTLILAMLLQRYEVRLQPGQQEPGIRLQVTVRPEGGMTLMLAPRAPVQANPAFAAAEPEGRCPFH